MVKNVQETFVLQEPEFINLSLMATTANLCKCNNCDSILIDQNPQINAKEYYLKGTELEMQYIPSIIEKGNVVDGAFWACPICMTDGYLDDDISGEGYVEVVTNPNVKS